MLLFALLVDKYKQPIMNLAYRMLRDMTEAEDLAQNVFVQVHKSAARYEVSSKFSTWLFTIARNLCLNEIRRRSRHPAESIEAPYYERKTTPSAIRGQESLFTSRHPAPGRIGTKDRRGPGCLARNQRTAILLCRQNELSYEENRPGAGMLPFGH